MHTPQLSRWPRQWSSKGRHGTVARKHAGKSDSQVTLPVHSAMHTHMNRTNSSLDWVLSHWAHVTLLRFIFVYVLFCVWLCSIVTWWGGPGGIEAWSLGPLLPSVLWHCWLSRLTHKTRPCMTYSVFSGTLPEHNNCTYNLRPRRHELVLAIKGDARNFVERQLFKDTY